MRIGVPIVFAALGLASAAAAQPVGSASLSQLQSACRTGDYAACSQYNAAVIAQRSAGAPVLQGGYDPFAMVPAVHTERQPKPPAADANTGKAGVASAAVEVVN